MRGRFFITAIALGALTTVAWAAERVTLRNGFEMNCDHHAEAEGRVRLYLSADADNYIEFSPLEIATVQHVADPPPAAIAKEPALELSQDPAKAGPELVPESANDAKLSPADLHEILAKAGGDHNLDVDLLASLVKAESGGNARAVSRTGARGLMQLMPGTAAELGVGDSFKPDQNVRGGSSYLDTLLTYYHNNLALALAAYNAGPATVDRYHGIPPYRETRAYVARVIHEFNRRVLAREAQARQAVASAPNSRETAGR
jgi:soluble lytic murein transglycosylase-like protein